MVHLGSAMASGLCGVRGAAFRLGGMSPADPAIAPDPATAPDPPSGPNPTPVPDTLLLVPLRQRITERHLGVRAIHVIRPGRATVSHLFGADTPENLYSISKTVTALAIGIAQHEGLLDLDDLLVDHLAAPTGGYGEGVDGIRLRHLLTMTSGSPVTAFVDEEREHPHLTGHFLGTDLSAAPGDGFVYSNGSIFMLSRVISERTGQSMRDWLMPRLFEPLGIRNPQWFTDVEGYTWGATGLHLTSQQMSRIGALLLAEGATPDGLAAEGTAPDGAEGEGTAAGEGRRLVPAAWIRSLHADDTWVPTGDPEPESGKYGLGVWKCTVPGSWRADGAFGQFLVILPEQNACVAITSHLEGVPGAEILRAVWEELLPLL